MRSLHDLVIRLAVVALCAGTGLAGCSSDDSPDDSAACPEDSLLTYRNFGDPFMRDWCTGCHSSDLQAGSRANAPPDVNFDSREGVLQWRDRIMVRALGENATMPPTSGPGEEEKVLLDEWLRCGAP